MRRLQLVIKKKQYHVKTLVDNLSTATKDIEFLLEVERLHLMKKGDLDPQIVSDSVGKVRIRAEARKNGHEWSGKYTPSRIRRVMTTLKKV